MKFRNRFAEFLAPERTAPNDERQAMVIRRPAPPIMHDDDWPSAAALQAHSASLADHYFTAIKQRIRLRIDGHTARTASAVLRDQTEHLKLMNDYQAAMNAFRLADLERQVRAAELHQRLEELAIQRRQNQRLHHMRLNKERLSLTLEIATLQRQIAEQRKTPQGQLTPTQQRLLKKAEIQQQLQQLQVDEDKAMQGAAGDLDKRRLQNMYAGRREHLMEQLEKYL